MDKEIAAWRARFPQYEYRIIDDAVLLKFIQPEYGCHCELGENEKPDNCVIDEGHPDDCALATELLRSGKDKTSCPEWRVIKQVSNV